jgi:hypothetical protein
MTDEQWLKHWRIAWFVWRWTWNIGAVLLLMSLLGELY